MRWIVVTWPDGATWTGDLLAYALLPDETLDGTLVRLATRREVIAARAVRA